MMQLFAFVTLSSNNPLKFNIKKGHTSGVYELKLVSKEILASGSGDMTIRLWNITNPVKSEMHF